jgi:hypothetical protein
MGGAAKPCQPRPLDMHDPCVSNDMTSKDRLRLELKRMEFSATSSAQRRLP